MAGSWSQMCGKLMSRFGEAIDPGWAPRITGPNAWNVGQESGPRNTDASKAPAGAIHWWRNRTVLYPGHTGRDPTGGGLMARWHHCQFRASRDGWRLYVACRRTRIPS